VTNIDFHPKKLSIDVALGLIVKPKQQQQRSGAYTDYVDTSITRYWL